MGLRDTVANAVASAFTASGDIPLEVTYHADGGASYNTVTGGYTRSDTDIAIYMILTRYSKSQIDGESILPNDMKALAKAVDFNGTPPKTNDQLTLPNGGGFWKVMSIEKDPTESLYTLQIRRS